MSGLSHSAVRRAGKAGLVSLILPLAISCVREAEGVSAPLRLVTLLSDGMVVQRDAPIVVRGQGTAGRDVVVIMEGDTASATIGTDGWFGAELPARAAGGPFAVRVESGDESVTVDNVLIGDVWVASGQSNMEWPLWGAEGGQAAIEAADDSLLRHFDIPHGWSWEPQPDVPGGAWATANPDDVGTFTAVGYFFARELRAAVDVPIGIINTTWGGSAIAPWIARESLGLEGELWDSILGAEQGAADRIRAELRERLGTLPEVDSGLVDGYAVWADPGLDDSSWAMLEVPGRWEELGYAGFDGVAWYRTSFELTAEEAAAGITLGLATIDDDDITWVNGTEVGRTNGYNIEREYGVPAAALRAGTNTLVIRVSDGGGYGGIIGDPDLAFIDAGGARRSIAGSWRFRVGLVEIGTDGQRINKIPAVLYNSMLHALQPFPIRGVIWYQGESNANNDEQAAAYAEPFQTMIRSWREQWRDSGEFPFLWVQLPNFGAPDTEPPATGAWAIMRESQSAALTLANTGQAIAIDIGDPGDIHPRNKLDVGRRLALVALAVAYGRDVVHSGPTYRSHTIDGGRISLEFDNTDGGLVSRSGSNVSGFAIAGADERFVWANARIEGDRVAVWNDAVPQPVAVRYAWSNSPVNPALHNGHDLPAAPFRTDHD
jgi:sialate O-acetylesterase